MKKTLIFALIAVAAVISSCNKKTENEDEYYIRYEGSVSTLPIVERSYTVATEGGKQTFKTRENSFTRTFGPVGKGFDASISISYSDDVVNLKTPSVHIEVSKNNGPFALKASGSKEASYQIDF
ncbi:MAG: hypothetical protein IKR69_06270 [Bacteroidales bacterium]|nr:hypothetical protein [Bacteroidales bacterium]